MDSVRTCLGCRQRSTTPFLLRVVARDGAVVADHSATLPGRGAWVHPSIECLDTALMRKAFGRALRKPDVTVDGAALREAVAHVQADPPDPRTEQADQPVNN